MADLQRNTLGIISVYSASYSLFMSLLPSFSCLYCYDVFPPSRVHDYSLSGRFFLTTDKRAAYKLLKVHLHESSYIVYTSIKPLLLHTINIYRLLNASQSEDHVVRCVISPRLAVPDCLSEIDHEGHKALSSAGLVVDVSRNVPPARERSTLSHRGSNEEHETC